MNFRYTEDGQRKNALVKLRLCPKCAKKLNYKQDRKRKRQEKKQARRLQKKQKWEKQPEVDDSAPKTSEAEGSGETEKGKRGTEAIPNIWQGRPKAASTPTQTQRFEDYFEGLFP